MTQYARWQEKNIYSVLTSSRVLGLMGARQCGKTTLSRSLSSFSPIYRTLDDAPTLASALDDPKGFVHHGDNLMIIDEVQNAPLLLPAIKQEVDEHPTQKGRFLITGSANIQTLPTVTESLAGRIQKIRLRPLSVGEISGTSPHFLDTLFAGDIEALEHKHSKEYNKDTYLVHAFDGGYPEPVALTTPKEKRQWHQHYVEVLIDRDLHDITQIRRRDSMKKLIQVLASRSSKYIDISDIGKSLSITRPTVEHYINTLEMLYLIERVSPWYKTDYDRVGKQEKLFITDTGLMSSLLRWNIDKVSLDGELNGKLIETFVFTQLMAIMEASEHDYRIYHYRDRVKREIDFLIENDDGALIGIEAKAGSAISRDSFKHMRWFKEHIAGDRPFTGIVLYSGEHILRFNEGYWAIPICSLWS